MPIFKRITKLLTAFLIISFLPFSSLVASQGQAQALEQNIFKKSEAILSIQFNEQSDYLRVLRTLPKSPDYGITNLTGQVMIDGKPFMISINGEYNINTINSAYRKEVRNFLGKLEHIKQKNTSDLRLETNEQKLEQADKEKLDRVLSGVSTNGIRISRFRSIFGNGQILNLVLVGSTDRLTSVRATLKQFIKKDDLITQDKIIEQKKAIENTVEELKKQGKTDEEAMVEVIREKAPKDQIKTVELSQDIITRVDSILKTEPNGNKFTTKNDLDSLKLTTEQEQTVQTLLSQYNQIPEVVKNDIGPLIDEIKTEINIGEKIGNVLFGGVQARAGWCNSRINTIIYWHGFRAQVNQCNIDKINALAAAFGAVYAYIAAVASASCAFVCHTLALGVALNVVLINWFNSRCGGDGVMLNFNFRPSYYYWWSIC